MIRVVELVHSFGHFPRFKSGSILFSNPGYNGFQNYKGIGNKIPPDLPLPKGGRIPIFEKEGIRN